MSKTRQITNVVSPCCCENYLAAISKPVLNAKIKVLQNKMLKTIQNLQMQNNVESYGVGDENL